jgi:hypothetical protein
VGVLLYVEAVGLVRVDVPVRLEDSISSLSSEVNTSFVRFVDVQARLAWAVVVRESLSSATRFCVRFVTASLIVVLRPAGATGEVEDTDDERDDVERAGSAAVLRGSGVREKES